MATQTTSDENSVGVVETQFHTFDRLALESGEQIEPVTLAFETYGKLNDDKSNAILILHALSGDAHAAGFHEGAQSPGWWDNMIGPGKGFDTDKYYVICSNIIGGCKGSTGPASVNPKTGKPHGLAFPLISVGDMVNAQRHLIDHLGIDRLLSVSGGSMGGMQVLQWMASYPERIRSAVPIATTLRHSPQQIAFNEVGRQSIMADPRWNNGDYYGGPLPDRGLAVARMVGHITYMSDKSMAEKFGRRLKDDRADFKFTAEFEVEGYLQYRGSSFVKRFDANSYLYVTKAIDYFDATGGKRLAEVFKGMNAEVMVIAFKSDWLYPAYQSQEIVKACKLAGLDVTYCEVDSSYGHDAFLLETEEETHLIKYFLEKVSRLEGKSEHEIRSNKTG
ncbi:MAG: homoserine O-acetyltransferase [Chloroflexi bacterium RBG_16_57_8]|nr:MAG: homoserine O-acetyltransferase [Chloroflexi bacterium RBG_16_57_8]